MREKRMSVGFGIIGCGLISKFHARAIQSIPGAQLVGCVSRRQESAASFANEFGGTPCSSLEELLGLPQLDAVAVCTPSGEHLNGILAAARAGKHVVVEKPLEITPERCDEAISACAQAGVHLAVAFQSRFHQAAIELKNAIEGRRFGVFCLADAYVKWYRTQRYYDGGAWRGTWDLDGGGALMNQAIHSVDLLLWLMGDVYEVFGYSATRAHERIEVEDTAVGVLRFQNGAIGVIEATTAAFPGTLKRIEISGSHGQAVLEEEDLKVWQFAEELPRDTEIRQEFAHKTSTGGGASDPAAIGFHGHAALYRDLMDAIQTGRSPLIDGQEGRRSVALICALYESARQGVPVRLTNPESKP
jgi:predicted dehydrogenase